jgi:hypothetical protein
MNRMIGSLRAASASRVAVAVIVSLATGLTLAFAAAASGSVGPGPCTESHPCPGPGRTATFKGRDSQGRPVTIVLMGGYLESTGAGGANGPGTKILAGAMCTNHLHQLVVGSAHGTLLHGHYWRVGRFAVPVGGGMSKGVDKVWLVIKGNTARGWFSYRARFYSGGRLRFVCSTGKVTFTAHAPAAHPMPVAGPRP